MTEDIVNRLVKDFADDSESAIAMLTDFERKNGFPERVTRCVVILSKGSLKELKNNIVFAQTDWRDVILWAEEDGLQHHGPFED